MPRPAACFPRSLPDPTFKRCLYRAVSSFESHRTGRDIGTQSAALLPSVLVFLHAVSCTQSAALHPQYPERSAHPPILAFYQHQVTMYLPRWVGGIVIAIASRDRGDQAISSSSNLSWKPAFHQHGLEPKVFHAEMAIFRADSSRKGQGHSNIGTAA